MRILVCGDRNWTNKEVIADWLLLYEPTVVIEGDARGADKMAGEIAQEEGIELEVYPADWDKYGKAAGPIRNQQMLKEGKPELVLAFHNNIKESKGTKHMISIASKAGIPVRVISELGID